MDELIQLLPLIIFVLALLGRVFRRKKPEKSEAEVALEDEQEVKLPPWGNIATTDEDAAEPFPDFLQREEPPARETARAFAAAEETQPPPDTPAPKPKEPATVNRTESRREVASARAAPGTVAGISLTPQTFRQGIILREILGPPRSLQRRRAEGENEVL